MVLMDDKTQKERLEQELRFLKESFEAEVISKEEFEKGKERIEKKLSEIKSAAKEQIIEETKQETTQLEEQKKDSAIKTKEPEKIKLKVIQDEVEGHEHFEPIQKSEQNGFPKKPIEEEILVEKKEKNNFLRYAFVFVVLLLVVFFSYSLLTGKKNAQEKATELNFIIACGSNDDCKQEGKVGICLQPATKDAKCEYREIAKTNVIVLNDRTNCFNCNTQRVLSILENWFGAIDAKEIKYNTDEGKNLADKFDAEILPIYILDENITKKPKFDEFKQIFIKKDNYYILDESAAGSTFYFKRDNMPNKLDFFVIAGDDASIKAEKNLKEFLDAFPEVKFERHLSNDKFAEELGINSFPTFLVNNIVKFSGVLAAETIKENFCKLNKLQECKKSLSKNLA